MKFEDAIALAGEDAGPSLGMTLNVVLRCILNLGAALACWVPMRLFHRNGELAGAVMVIATAIMNFYYGVDSLIWPNNDVQTWFKGYSWCDIQLVLWIPLETLNAAAICAVMQNIAVQANRRGLPKGIMPLWQPRRPGPECKSKTEALFYGADDCCPVQSHAASLPF